MSHNAPGKSYRKGISLVQTHGVISQTMPQRKRRFIEQRWPTGIACPNCGSLNVQTGAKHKTMPFRCREKECAKRFSTKSLVPLWKDRSSVFRRGCWTTFLMTTNLEVSLRGMKLHRDLEINQRSAWFLAHRLRVALAEEGGVFSGPIEVDETYIGGRRHNMSNARRKELSGTGRGAVGKAAVVGAKDRGHE